MDWSMIMTAKEASLKLGKNEKYIYTIWRKRPNILLKNSVVMKGNTLLITREGYEYLKKRIEEGAI